MTGRGVVPRPGLDSLLRELDGGSLDLRGRSYGLLCHQASLSGAWRPAHVELADRGCPAARLFAPEHGFYGVEQDMVAARDRYDPLTDCEIVSLYGEDETSLRPVPAAFEGIDLLVVDLQDVGARYYTFAATAVWAARTALEAGCEVWILDRPNPLGGEGVEGNLVEAGMESFVSAFPHPARHGLTVAELMRLELMRSGHELRGRIFEVEGWAGRGYRSMAEPFVAPSPNMPTLAAAALYPGLCLIEGTELSEGRGTTRPFQLIGAPFVAPGPLAAELDRRARELGLGGVAFVPSFFRPQFQKHGGEVCGGVELVVTDAQALAPYRLGVLLLEVFKELHPEDFRWRTRAYEFVNDRPAIDLLAGTSLLRRALDQGDARALEAWLASWRSDEDRFREERASALIYSGPG